MFTLHSVFIGKIDAYIEYFAGKVMKRSESLGRFLAPLVSILRNLYLGATTLGEQEGKRYLNLQELL